MEYQKNWKGGVKSWNPEKDWNIDVYRIKKYRIYVLERCSLIYTNVHNICMHTYTMPLYVCVSYMYKNRNTILLDFYMWK